MKLAFSLLDEIDDELDGACHYAMGYQLYKEKYPMIAETYKTLANTELSHAERLKGSLHGYLAEHKDPEYKKDYELLRAMTDREDEKIIKKTADVREMLR